jgi:imidazolonepropionase-like amidohydrolase
MELLHRAGLPTPAILTAATRNGAEALRIIHKVGTIAEGKLADLVVLDGDFCRTFRPSTGRLQCSKEAELYTERFQNIDASGVWRNDDA